MAIRRDTPLLAVVLGTAAFGAAMVLLPAATRQGYGLLMYGDMGRMDTWPAEARQYVTLLHGVLGAVLLAWAVALAALLRGRWRHEDPHARAVIAASVGLWFVVDTAFSAAVGAWPNVMLNAVFGLAFAAALRHSVRS